MSPVASQLYGEPQGEGKLKFYAALWWFIHKQGSPGGDGMMINVCYEYSQG